MRLLKIDIVGFKSFAYPTSVVFDEGITSIVGPNGCGKSNIVDAIFWCMGEQSAKNLRGSSMEDVIFNGASHIKPGSMAEVTITFSREGVRLRPEFEGFTEITVTRRLYRSGDSEYQINRISCRLRDIHELFLDTGIGNNSYAIIKQGQIERLINMKPAERRMIIEEAAGITKFKVKKHESMKKMDETVQNLEKLTIIIDELKNQTDKLAQQSEKALKYQALRDQYRDLLLATHRQLFVQYDAQLVTRSQQVVDQERQLVEAETELSQLSVKEETNTNQYVLLEDQYQQLEKRLADLTAQITTDEKEELSLRLKNENSEKNNEEEQQRLSEIQDELTELGTQLEQLQSSLQSGDERLLELATKVEQGELARKEQQIKVNESEAAVNQAKNELAELEAKSEAIVRNQEFLHREMQNKQARINETKQQSAQIVADFEKMSAQKDLQKKEVEEKIMYRDSCEANCDEFEERVQDLKTELDGAEKEVRKWEIEKQTLQKHQQYLQQLQQNFEGMGTHIKSFLKSAQSGQLADLLEVKGLFSDFMDCNPKNLKALGKVAEQLLEAIIIEPKAELELLVEALKQKFKGSFRFVLTDSQFAKTQSKAEFKELSLGAQVPIKVHSALVNFCDAYFASTQFRDDNNLQNLEGAAGFWVTPQGTMGWKNSFVAFGESSPGLQGRLEREQELVDTNVKIENVETQLLQSKKQLQRLQEQHEQVKEELSLSKEQLDNVRSELEELRVGLNQTELHCSKINQTLQSFQQKENEWNQEFLAISDRVQRENKTLERHQERQQILKRGSFENEARQIALRAGLLELMEEYENNWKAKMRLEEETKNFRDKVRTLQSRQDHLENQKETMEEAMVERMHDRKRCALRLEELKSVLVSRVQNKRSLENEAQALREAIHLLRNQNQELSQVLRERRKNIDERRKLFAEFQLALKSLEMDIEKVRSKVKDKLDEDVADPKWQNLTSFATEQELESALKQVDRVNREISALGEINLSAIREYEQSKERYDFLSTQKNDLDMALLKLREAVEKIDHITSARFLETFHKVNEHFGRLFPALFNGGNARLVMTEPEKILDTGIEIIAQPPGKNPATLNLLSGGEKALTAVSLIFGIFNLKPAPFCLLDEVDAPLDDANIGRFNLLIQKMSKLTQFILITHNKKTMEAARNMFGVTQEIKGISKVASVRLRDESDGAITNEHAFANA